MVLLMLADLGATIYLAKKHTTVLMEPSAPIRLTTTPHDPMSLYATILADHSGLDILVPSNLEYIYFFRYAPPTVVGHLYFVAVKDDLYLAAYARLAKEAHIDLQVTSYEPFLANHSRFLLYVSGPAIVEGAQNVARAGYRLTDASSDSSGILYRYEK
jgi:hypothetical protein